MALLPGQEKAGGEGTAPSALRLGLGWEGGNDQGSLLGWGWLRGQQSRRVRGQIPRGCPNQPAPGVRAVLGLKVNALPEVQELLLEVGY